MLHRPRRLRQNKALRSLVRETKLTVNDFVYPLFVVSGSGIKKEIKSLPGNYHYSRDLLLKEVESLIELNLKAVLLFGIPQKKDEQATAAWQDDGLIPRTVRQIKKNFPELLVITDICLCGYTDHGHCGLIENKQIANDTTLEILEKIALTQARAGVDIVAPSDMMDGRVGVIRKALDREGFSQVALMSYSVKYASSFYGPFREAAQSAPAFGDRKTYQMDPANSREALKEVKLDIEEGADIIMVKPALAYLDIIHRVKEITSCPVAAYSVSGEFSLVVNGARNGLCSEEEMMIEVLTAIKRAGADLIISYYAKRIGRILKNSTVQNESL